MKNPIKQYASICTGILAICLYLFTSCQTQSNRPKHIGKKSLSLNITKTDSIQLKAESISWNGNFFVLEDKLYFIDKYYCNLFVFDWNTGESIDKMLGKGHSNSEVTGLRYGYPLHGKEHCIAIVDNDNRISIYDIKKRKEVQTTLISNQDIPQEDIGNYESPYVYNLMELSDVGVDFYMQDSNTVLVPLSLTDRHLNSVDISRYEHGHIWGTFNLESNKMESVSGRLPYYYLDNPAPNFEHFRYLAQDDRYYVNHAVDSLIYVYNKDRDAVLYTFGYETEAADRSYTGKNFEVDIKSLRQDIRRVSINSGMVICKEKNIMLRETVNRIIEENVTTSVQLYDYTTGDLLAEELIDGFIHFLYIKDDCLYGINRSPNDQDLYYIYKFKITIK